MIRINLLPVRQQRKRQAFLQYLVASAVGLALIIVFSLFGTLKVNGDIAKIDKDNETLRTEIEYYKRIIGEIEEFEQMIEERRRKKEVIERLRSNRQAPVKVLDELASRMPKKVWLKEVVRSRNRMQLKGGALSQRDIANFMLALEESEYFNNVKLEEIKRDDEPGVDETIQQFQIVCNVINPKAVKAPTPEGEAGDKDGPADSAGGAR